MKFILLLLSSLTFANDKAATGALIQKKFGSARRQMQTCLEFPGRQIYPTFTAKFAIKVGKAQDIHFTGAELKATEETCLEGVIKKINFEGIASALASQTVNFRLKSED